MKVKKNIKKSTLTKITMNVPDDLLDKISIKSKEMGISRTSFILISVNEYLKQQETITQLPSFIQELKKLQAQTEIKKKTKQS